MSIDYDLLEEQLHTTTGQEHSRAPWQVGNEDKDGFFDVRDTDYNVVAWRMTRKEAELVALAPDMARELLRLHRELTDLRDEYARIATVCNCTDDPVGKTQAGTLQSASMRLARIIQGDTE